MRILFQYSNYSIKYNYYTFKKLKKLDENIEIGLCGLNDFGRKFFKKKEKIFKQFVPLDAKNFKPRNIVNHNKLKEFQKFLDKESMWKIIASDRSLGSSFKHGYIGYESKYSRNRNIILEYVSELIESYEKIFDNFKPDIFIPAIAMGDVGLKILEIICMQRNIRYLSLESVRIQNYCTFASNSQLDFKNIDKRTESYLNSKSQNISNEAIDLLAKLKQKNNIDYFDLQANKIALKEYKFKNYFLNSFYLLIILYPLKVLYDCLNLIKNIFQLNYNNLPFIKLLIKIKYRYKLTLQKIFMSNPKIYSNLNKNEKYIYYPLMSQPEYGINVLGTMWMNQIELVRTIAKSIPYDWYVYVKEHPGTLNDRLRPKNYYKDILSIPNIRFIDIKEDTSKLIEKSKAVFVISGTTGFEAILNNKPLFETRRNIWTIMELSKIIKSSENLYLDIIKEVERHNLMSGKMREYRLLSFIQAVLDTCFYFSHPDVLLYDRAGTEEENKKCGEELGEYLYNFLHKKIS